MLHFLHNVINSPVGEGTAITDISTLISNGVQPVFQFLVTSLTTIATTILGSPFLVLTTCIMVAFVGFKALGKILRQY